MTCRFWGYIQLCSYLQSLSVKEHQLANTFTFLYRCSSYHKLVIRTEYAVCPTCTTNV